MEILVNTPGTSIRQDGAFICIDNKTKKKRIPLGRVRSLLLGDRVSISTNSILILLKNQVDIFFVDWKGEVLGCIATNENKPGGKAILNQVDMVKNHRGLYLSKRWIAEKIRGYILHLNEIEENTSTTEELEMLIEMIEKECDKSVIRGHEGRAGHVYFKKLRNLSKNKRKILSRNIRPAKDIFNTALNYIYGILYREIENEMKKRKIETSIGFFHSSATNRIPLVYDFIEGYRPYFIRALYKIYEDGKLDSLDFKVSGEGIRLEDEAKKVITSLYVGVMDSRYSTGRKETLKERLKREVLELKKEIYGISSL